MTTVHLWWGNNDSAVKDGDNGDKDDDDDDIDNDVDDDNDGMISPSTLLTLSINNYYLHVYLW